MVTFLATTGAVKSAVSTDLVGTSCRDLFPRPPLSIIVAAVSEPRQLAQPLGLSSYISGAQRLSSSVQRLSGTGNSAIAPLAPVSHSIVGAASALVIEQRHGCRIDTAYLIFCFAIRRCGAAEAKPARKALHLLVPAQHPSQHLPQGVDRATLRYSPPLPSPPLSPSTPLGRATASPVRASRSVAPEGSSYTGGGGGG